MTSDTTVGDVVIGVPLALGAAACFGIASVMQHRVAREVPLRRPGRPVLLLDLLRKPRFRWSVVLTVLAFGLQVAALKLIPLILVQPMLITGLLWYVLLGAVLEHHRPDTVLTVGATGALASLGVLLVLGRPTAPATRGLESIVREAFPLAVGLGAAVGACLIAAAAIPRPWRSLPIALAAGICYGVTAGLVRSLSPYFQDGLLAVFSHWQTYGVLVVGQFGVLLSLNAYQAGRQGSPALAIMTITDPLVAMAVGWIWLGERIRTGPGWLAGELIAFFALVGFVYLLSVRAPHVRDDSGGQSARGSSSAAASG